MNHGAKRVSNLEIALELDGRAGADRAHQHRAEQLRFGQLHSLHAGGGRNPRDGAARRRRPAARQCLSLRGSPEAAGARADRRAPGLGARCQSVSRPAPFRSAMTLRSRCRRSRSRGCRRTTSSVRAGGDPQRRACHPDRCRAPRRVRRQGRRAAGRGRRTRRMAGCRRRRRGGGCLPATPAQQSIARRAVRRALARSSTAIRFSSPSRPPRTGDFSSARFYSYRAVESRSRAPRSWPASMTARPR